MNLYRVQMVLDIVVAAVSEQRARLDAEKHIADAAHEISIEDIRKIESAKDLPQGYTLSGLAYSMGPNDIYIREIIGEE